MPDPVIPGASGRLRDALPPAVEQAARSRPAAAAGLFYPADARQLRADLDRMLRNAGDQTLAAAPKAIIVPHAGYLYSGETAARAYARLGSRRGTIRRVVLLGPAHRVQVRGIALPEVEAFDTPLGAVEVDQAALHAIAHLRQVVAARPVHVAEHSLEVHLPFLRAVLGEFSLVPLVVGEATPAMVAEVLELLWGGAETLIVISSDLSHYHAYRDALRIDGETVALILKGATTLNHEQACGATPVNALMQIARSRHLRVELIDQCNSGDSAGPRDRVVGYASFAVYEADQKSLVPQRFPPDGGAQLLQLARAAIEQTLGVPGAQVAMNAMKTPSAGSTPSSEAVWLEQPGAVFVTLTHCGALRGCMGSLVAHRALRADVIANAGAAALRDPRFAPITADEWPEVRVEVSVLTAPQPLTLRDEADALAQLRPHQDGVILEAGAHRATFLPQVWEQIPAPRAFLAALKQKAGLPAGYWGPDLRLSRYGVAKFRE